MPVHNIRTRISPDFSFETPLWERGFRYVAGIDEVGRGALAGPVAAAVLIFPPDLTISNQLIGMHDSKQMSPSRRTYWSKQLEHIAIAWGVGYAQVDEIDALGIVPATRLAAQRALDSLPFKPHHLLVDFIELPEVDIPQTSLVKGDARSYSIAAASILAKTSRDRLCCELDHQHPGYGFARHKGYGTSAHLEALRLLGPSPVHRGSFKPVADLLLTSDVLPETLS